MIVNNGYAENEGAYSIFIRDKEMLPKLAWISRARAKGHLETKAPSCRAALQVSFVLSGLSRRIKI